MTDPKDAERLAEDNYTNEAVKQIVRFANSVIDKRDAIIASLTQDLTAARATINEMSAANTRLQNMYHLAMGGLAKAEQERDEARRSAGGSGHGELRKLGKRDGIRWAITWLHRQAESMSDPKAKAILNSAAFGLGNEIALAARDAAIKGDK